jgi:hypothetical protein
MCSPARDAGNVTVSQMLNFSCHACRSLVQATHTGAIPAFRRFEAGRDMDGHGRTWADMDGHGRTWMNMDGHGRTWTDMDEYGRTWMNMNGHG